jgi:TonB-linked SusC/RagA family outer membrane protein
MKFIYMILGWTFLVLHPGVSNPLQVYAASKKLVLTPVSPDSNSLKEGLKDVEKAFGVSIAFKDEWVEGKKAQFTASAYSSAEEALNVLLKGTDLLFKKAGEQFYVIAPKKQRSDVNTETFFLTSPVLMSDLRAANNPDYSGYMIEAVETTKVKTEINVSGTITDDSSNPIPGVNVLIKGTSTGSTSDAAGRYSISVPNEATVLVFSFVGFVTMEETVGSRTVIDVMMKPDVKQLTEIVVTALGIEKPTKSLGYATSKVDAKELTVNRTPNFMNSLQGKVAGVNITALGTGPGGTSKVRIRGQSSISGQNNPLIVINGVPVDNTNFGTNPNNLASDNSVGVRAGGGITSDGGDGLTSINPDDIESMTVLKGATAAALYGSRAKDGVIMITTKSKGEGKGIGISYNLNYTNETPLDFTDYQYEYGQGENGVRPTTANPTSGQWSFGEKFQEGMTQTLFDGVVVPYVPQYDRIKNFYRNGQTFTNTIALSSGGEKGGFNLSLANMKSEGITPNNEYSRKTVNLGFNYSLSDKLGLRGNINYSNEYNQNPPNVGNQDNTIPVAIYNMSNSMPLDLLREKRYNAQGNEFIYSRFQNRTNPYFTLSDQFNNIRRDRVFGNIALRYDFTSWLYVQGRVGQDYWSRDQDYNNFPTGQASRPAAPAPYVNGLFTQESRRFRELNADFLLVATKDFGKIGTNLTFGGNHMYRRSDLNSVQVTDFVIRGLYTVQNGRAKDPQYTLIENKVNSLYGSVEFSYNDFIYLNGTLRDDWFSTLSEENRSVLYPSVSTGVVVSELFDTPPSWLSFAKVRAAYAEVGSDSDVGAYADKLYYGVNSNFFANPSGALQPLGGPLGTTIPNSSLVPMRVAETEIGIELKMFDERLSIDVAAYQKITNDQIVNAQVSDASGYVDTRINSGKSRNKGIEMLVNVIPVKTNDFQWTFTANSAYNITKVLSIITDKPGERITVGTHIFNGELRQVVGEELGMLAGFGYLRDSQGRIVYGANGIPLATPSMIYHGSALPKWVGGFMNSFAFKGVSMSFLIDYKLGGKMISGTNFNAVRHGLHKMTLEGRESGIIGEGVNEAGEVNTVVAPVQPYYEVVRSKGLIEPIVYDAGYWKLRQVSIGYDFTRFLPADFPIRGVRLDLVANNVYMIKKWVPNIDPESFGYSSDNLVGLESTGTPSTRSIGFNLNVKL